MFTMLCGGELKSSILNPFDSSSRLFILFGSVHLLKCIRNNWINQTDPKQTIIFPDYDNKEIILRASFSDLKMLHNVEEKKILKLAPTLNYKALYPTNIERQKVSLALKIFNEKTAAALQYFPEMTDTVIGTRKFIELIMQLWKILNIKSQSKGKHLRDAMCDPFRSTSDSRFEVLKKTVAWLEHWDTMNFSLKGRQGKLSNETHCVDSHFEDFFSHD